MDGPGNNWGRPGQPPRLKTGGITGPINGSSPTIIGQPQFTPARQNGTSVVLNVALAIIMANAATTVPRAPMQGSLRPVRQVQQPYQFPNLSTYGATYSPIASRASAPYSPRAIQQPPISPAQLALYTTDNSALPVVERRALTVPWFDRQRPQSWQFQPPFTPTITYTPPATQVASQYQSRTIQQPGAPWIFNTFTPAATYTPAARSVSADVFKREWQQAKPLPARLEFYTTDNSGLPVLERTILSTNRFEIRYQQTQVPNSTFGLIAQGGTYSPPAMTVSAQINSQRVSMDSIQLALYMINDGYFPVAQQIAAQINPRAFTFHPLPTLGYTVSTATYAPAARIVSAQQNAVRDTPVFMQLANYIIADYTPPSAVVLAQINRTPFVTHIQPTLGYGGTLTSYSPPAAIIPAQINRVPFVTHPQPALVYGGTLSPYVSPPVVAVAANPLLPVFENSGFFQVAHYELYTTEPVPPPPTDQPCGGWEHHHQPKHHHFYYDFDAHRAKRVKRDHEREEREREAELLEGVEREIAQLLHEQEARDADAADLRRLQQLADQYAGTRQEVPRAIAATLLKAHEERSRNALEQLGREMERMLQEEELALLMVLLNDD